METDDLMNSMLIDCVKQYPTLYNTEFYTENDESYWNEIQSRLGIHKSWLKRRWHKIRNEFRKITVYNHIHSKKLPPYKWTENLSFLVVDLNGFADMDFSDLIHPKKESFNITQEMLDNCDIDENVTFESISRSEAAELSRQDRDAKPAGKSEIMSTRENSATMKRNVPDVLQQSLEEISTNQRRLSQTAAENRDENKSSDRDEDAIFIELVGAMLKRMNPDEKKRAKKEIMNILL